MTVERDLLVISDLHLGEALGSTSDRTRNLDRALVAFLDHHALGHKWRLVVNGDMLDLVGATVHPAEVGWIAGLHPDDHTYGLGGRELGAVLKLRRVLEHHEPVFRAFARFLAAGNPVDIVIGNHDAELHWPEVQRELSGWLTHAALAVAGDPEDLGEIVFHPWFYLEDGLVFFEHGHQYDPYCAFEDLLEPATDEEEIDPNLGALLPRYVGSRMLEPVHEAWGMGFFEFLQFWFRQGSDRILSILEAYLHVFQRMWEHQRSRLPERLAARRARARDRLRRMASRLKLPEERLHRLASFWVAPIGIELARIVRALMLDRLALLTLGPMLPLAAFVLTPWPWQVTAHVLVALVLLGCLAVASVAREPVDPQQAMRAVARRVREVMNVPIVVMGHSHVPHAEFLGTGWYFNTGTWVQPDPALAFTHLRIERTLTGARARLCQWRDGAVAAYDAAGPEVNVLVARSRP